MDGVYGIKKMMRIGIGNVTLQIFQDLFFIKGQHNENQVVFAVNMLSISFQKKEYLIFDGAKVLVPTGDHEANSRIVFSNRINNLQKSSRKFLSLPLIEMDKNFV